jgi:hypothetical protein
MSVLAVHFIEPRLVDCRWCKGTGQGRQRSVCSFCDGVGGREVFESALATLALNLAIAGALCESFYLGKVFTHHAMLDLGEPMAWHPCCGRSAP